VRANSGQFLFGLAGNVVAGGVAVTWVVVANQFSVPRHPGHYATGSFFLCLLVQLVIIELAFLPMFASRVRLSRLAETWVINVSSSILAAFVLAYAAAGFGLIEGTALQWPPFLLQLLSGYFAVAIATLVLAGPMERDSDPSKEFPASAWIGCVFYWIGAGLVLLGILKLTGLAEGLTVGFGAIVLVLGNSVVLTTTARRATDVKSPN
jgi:hypothetical protein